MEKEIAITAYKCKSCGKLHYPYHDRCLSCRKRDFEEVKPSGNAKLITYTAIFNLPWGFDERYLIMGVAEFENNIKAMGQINAESVSERITSLSAVVGDGWRIETNSDISGLTSVAL